MAAGSTQKDSTGVNAQQLNLNVRTFPLRFSFIRGDMYNNLDLSIIKNTQIAKRSGCNSARNS